MSAKKMQEEELKNAAGGTVSGDGSIITSDWLDKIGASKGFIDIECQFCHKPFKYSRFWLDDWSGLDEDGRHHYNVHTCPECKKTHPFKSKTLRVQELISKSSD